MTDDFIVAFKGTLLKHYYDDTMAQAICGLLNALNGAPLFLLYHEIYSRL